MAKLESSDFDKLIVNLFAILLQTLFIGLKLTHQIDWSWWWVFTPLWAQVLFALVVVAIIVIYMWFKGLL